MNPRSKNKICADYTIDDIYKYYKDIHGNDDFMVDKKTFKKVLYSFNKKVFDAILNDSEELKLPNRMGFLRIKKTKMNFKDERACSIDYNLTKQYGKTIYHLNDHTNNYRYRFYWKKSMCNAKNKSAYSFEATRTNKRRLAHILKNNITDYYL